MSALQSLNDTELTDKIKSLAREERELTRNIIEHIAEIDRRKTFLAMAYSSLFEYLTKEIGYSEGAAQRRIDAARLLQRVPEVAEKIEVGTLNLAQISKLQRTMRLAKRDGRKIEVSDQRAILEKLEHRSGEQTDLILAKEFALPVQIEERKQIQRDESVRVELTFSKEEMALINQARDILSNKTGGGLKKTMLEMAGKIVAERAAAGRTRKAVIARASSTATVAVKMPAPVKTAPAATATERPPVSAPRTLTPRLRKDILNRDRCCQYRDKTTGRVCGSTRFLEVDHVQPRFAGGSNATENLRILCRNHNGYRYWAEQQT